jgi:hypothetical protein
MSRTGFALALFAALTLCGSAIADSIRFQATLNGENEVPLKVTKGSGDASATLDTQTRTLTYTVTYSGLSGPATMGHFHGPALAGANAPVVVPLGSPLTSPIKGSVTLTEAQMADLMAGKWYVNLHTAASPAGEIRGQMTH